MGGRVASSSFNVLKFRIKQDSIFCAWPFSLYALPLIKAVKDSHVIFFVVVVHPYIPFFPDTGHNWSKIHWIFVLVGRLNFLGGKAKWNGVEKNIFLTSFAVSDHFVRLHLIQQDKLGNHYYDLHLPTCETEVF